MFRGNHAAKVDDKGRLKIPSAFKTLLDAANVTQFYITSVDGKNAQIWPLPEWEKREAELAEKGTGLEVVERYLDLTSYYGHQVEIDSQSRVVLPQILREKGKLDAEVLVFGKLTYLEVKNEKAFEQRLPGLTMTAEETNQVAALSRSDR